MPPQQPQRLLDLFDDAFDFRTHVSRIPVSDREAAEASRRRRRKQDGHTPRFRAA
jgi:hypothetical protein